ncbi:hypothetical protein MTO96_043566, partial [Rhipicephalus appendiculatus]
MGSRSTFQPEEDYGSFTDEYSVRIEVYETELRIRPPRAVPRTCTRTNFPDSSPYKCCAVVSSLECPQKQNHRLFKMLRPPNDSAKPTTESPAPDAFAGDAN